MITDKVDKLLRKIAKDTDLTHELQTEIDPSLRFRRNSVNLFIGKRGSGKTYNVFRELLKLKYVRNHCYSKLLYVTDKPNDPTFERIADELPFEVDIVPYSEAVEAIREIADAKAAVKEMREKHIDSSMLEDDSKDQIESALGESIDKTRDVYHTAVLLDDAQNMFQQKTKANKDLIKLLFENRQPKITYFICLQDAKGLDTSLKENADSVWVFGSFSQQKFMYTVRYIPCDEDRDKLWQMYHELNRNQALIINNWIEKCEVTQLLN